MANIECEICGSRKLSIIKTEVVNRSSGSRKCEDILVLTFECLNCGSVFTEWTRIQDN